MGIVEARAALTAPGAAFEIVEEDVRGVRLPVFRHRARSLRELLAGSVRFSDRPYVIQDDVRLDFRTHAELVDALAAALVAEHGVRAGDRVALFAANRWEWVVSFWAILATGAIPAAFNGWWTVAEASDALDLVEPKLIIGDRARLERIAATTPASARPRVASAAPEAAAPVAGAPDAVASALPMLNMDADLPGLFAAWRGRKPPTVAGSENDAAMLIFTSGTTGRAKAVTMPHRALCGQVQLTALGEAAARVAQGGPLPPPGEPTPAGDDVILVTSPLFHVSMLYGAVFPAIVKGAAMVLVPGRFEPERVLRAIERERVTFWMALGSAAPRVCASTTPDRYDTTSVRAIGIGGAPVSPAVQQALRETFPTAAFGVSMGYTSTEAGASIANINGPEYVAHPTSTGRIMPTVAVELRDPLGAPVPDGQLGEIHVRSSYVMLGYWNDPKASAAVLRDDGWLAMGDLARLRDGLLYVDSRARDLILVSAENVSPTEIEYRLEAHPDVLEAAVLAVDDAVTGDAVHAVVVTAPGTPITGDDLRAWCRSTLAHYKVPTSWRIVHEPLPRTPSGKLLKHRLRPSR